MLKKERSLVSMRVDKRNKENVDAYLSGDKKAVSRLYEDNYMFVKNSMMSKLSNNNYVSEDLTQDVMIKMINNLSRFKNTETLFRSWLTSIINSVFIDYVRKQKNGFIFETLDSFNNDGGENLSDDMENVIYNNSLVEYGLTEETFSLFVKKERSDALRLAIKKLDNVTHKRVMNKLLSGKSYNEISNEIGENIGTIKSIIFRVKKELSKNEELIEALS
jgi:RNA polymerase sigma factor (sigma-70 family)